MCGINYAPEIIGVGRYAGEIGAYFAARGHQVEVIAAPPHYPSWRVEPPFRAGAYAWERREGVDVLRCPIYATGKARGLARILAPVSFALSSAPAVAWRILRTRPDVVFCTEPTLLSAPVALVFAKLVGARTVLHVQDLEFDAAFAVGHVKAGLVRRMAQLFERHTRRGFGRVVTISNRMRDKLVAKGVPADRVCVVRNWTDTSAIRPLQGANAFRGELGLSEDEFVALYAGQIGAKQALHQVFAAAEAMVDHPRLRFVIAGDGPLKAELVARYGHLPNVRFLPLQPEERLCELLNLADLHVLPQDANAADLVLPSKLAGMLASGRPVLATAATGTELHDVLSGFALLVPPGDATALVQALRSAASDTFVAPQGGLALANDLFSKSRNLSALLDMIERFVHVGANHPS